MRRFRRVLAPRAEELPGARLGRPGPLRLADRLGAFKAVLAGPGIAHRRGGYRDPESQAFIDSWFGKLKQRCVWRHQFETLDQAEEVSGAYVIHYHHRPHSRLDYRTPLEVAATWNDGGLPHLIQRPELSTRTGSTSEPPTPSPTTGAPNSYTACSDLTNEGRAGVLREIHLRYASPQNR
jgi:hypothetical protein